MSSINFCVSVFKQLCNTCNKYDTCIFFLYFICREAFIDFKALLKVGYHTIFSTSTQDTHGFISVQILFKAFD